MHILDKDTGKELHNIKLPNGVQGVPAVYEADAANTSYFAQQEAKT